MEDKKVLKDEELEKVNGGSGKDWYSKFYCEKCRQPYNISGLIDTYKCPDCGGELKLTSMPISGYGYWYFYKCSNCGTEYEKTVTGFGDKMH